MNFKAKVIFITGFGGQGKSALAAYYLNKMSPEKGTFIDWRDFKEESHNFQGKIISMISLVSQSKYSETDLTGRETSELIGIFFRALDKKSAIFVLDNIDSYINIDTFLPSGSMALFFEATLKYDRHSYAPLRSKHSLF